MLNFEIFVGLKLHSNSSSNSRKILKYGQRTREPKRQRNQDTKKHRNIEVKRETKKLRTIGLKSVFTRFNAVNTRNKVEE